MILTARLGMKAEMPTINRCSRIANETLFEKSFAVIGPKLSNWLPSQLSIIDKQNTFNLQKSITKYLMNLVYMSGSRGKPYRKCSAYQTVS